ncbi:MAG: NADH-quinone oxidoreductase subunit C [Clostridiales bacterium]|nr:NADH-quinone oxidoreductase subunit C [Clostridiales bacterium]
MRENYVYVDLPSELLPLKAVKAKNNKARLVQICAVNTETGYDLLYSFATGYHFVTYKVAVSKDEEVPSISDIYPSSSLYENEMRELFGVNVKYMKLNYHNKLYTIDEKTPFRPEQKEADVNG